jgi:hypothetical protein
MKVSVDDSHVDNSHSGGITMAVSDDGRLSKQGLQISTGKKFTKHPLTGIKFSEFTIPFWDAAKELVVNAHKHLYGMNSVGWDVAITPYGPILIEGNSKWDMTIFPQLTGEAPEEKYGKYFSKKRA